MSLRLQLILSMISALLISLILVGTLAWWNAARSVTTEMRAALDAGGRMVGNTIAQLPATSDDPLYVERLIPAFDGNRHIKATLIKADGVASAESTMADSGQSAPEWFFDLVGVPRETLSIPLPTDTAPYRTVLLESDPHNEVGEVWGRTHDDMLILAFFCAATVLLGHIIVSRALASLKKLSAGISVIGTGDYGARVEHSGPPEIAGLAASFNTMAEDLGALETKNRRLTAQLLTIQEEERTDLARDLHDEIGPFLFAVNVDAAAIARAGTDQGLSEIVAQVRSIQESVSHMQRHVRSILSRLRPAGLHDVGLEQAVNTLAAFWQRRHPDISIRVHITADAAHLDEAYDTAIYRVIQESLSNAVRHGHAHGIDVTVAEIAGDITVEIADDGIGLAQTHADAAHRGFGVIGMKERIVALGGHIVLTNRTDGSGVVVTARLPRAAVPEIALP